MGLSFALGKRFAVAKLTASLSARAKLRPRLLVASGRLIPSPEIQVSTGKDLLIPRGRAGLEASYLSPISLPISLFCDNVSATYFAVHPLFHARTKHIEIDYHFVRECVARGTLRVLFVSTDHQVADVFTKGLSVSKFSKFRDMFVHHQFEGEY